MLNTSDKPVRCVDVVMKYCQECPYGIVSYPDEEDVSFFEVSCMYGLEHDEPTSEELAEFEEFLNYYKPVKGKKVEGIIEEKKNA